MSETNADTLRRAAADLSTDASRADRNGGFVSLYPSQARYLARLFEAIADDDPGDPLHDPACRTCTAALDAARAYLGESR